MGKRDFLGGLASRKSATPLKQTPSHAPVGTTIKLTTSPSYTWVNLVFGLQLALSLG